MKTIKKLISLALAAAFIIALALPSLAFMANEASMGKNSAVRDAANLNEALNVPGGNLTFQTSSDYPWVPEGDIAISTNSGMPMTSSSVWTNVTAAAGDMLQFEFWSLGEGVEYFFDGLQLIIDGSVIAQWGQTTGWQTYTMALTPGSHEIRFSYTKDYSIDEIYDFAMLDNVYVGQSILPASISVSPVNVPVGRRANVNYTILPENAMDKSCTFTTANPNIATVDASGVVTGVAVGTTTVTVTSTANPSVSGTATVTVTEAVSGVELEGFVLVDFDSAHDTTGSWIRFSDHDPSYVETTAQMPNDTYGAAYYNGNVYGYLYGANDSRFFVMNAATHQISFPGGSSGTTMVRGMAYNYANDTMYAIANDSLATVDLNTGALNIIADFTGSADDLMTIAIDGEGNAYGLTLNSIRTSLVRINLETAVCSLVGELTLGLNFAQSMTWDHGTNKLYWAHELDVSESGLYTIDVDTLAVTPYGRIGRLGMEVSCLYTTSEPSSGLIGDADVNGSVSIADAILALRHAMGLHQLTGQGYINADVDGNGSVTTADAIMILRIAMGLAG